LVLDQADPQDEPGLFVAGFYAYEPSPVAVYLTCEIANFGVPNTVYRAILAPPTILSSYQYRHRENPQRNFWTSPQDTYSINDGIITGHKYTSMSPIKSFIDLITSPIRSAFPSGSSNSSVSVNEATGARTRTDSTTLSPSKGP